MDLATSEQLLQYASSLRDADVKSQLVLAPLPGPPVVRGNRQSFQARNVWVDLPNHLRLITLTLLQYFLLP